MAIDLSSDWLRKDNATPSYYYGYAKNADASKTESVWAIRKITASGSSDIVLWNDNKILDFSAKWSERSNNFIAPTASIGLTWSVTNSTNSFNITKSLVNLSWSDLSGVNNYTVKISDQNGVVYNYLHQAFSNAFILSPLTSQQAGNTYRFVGVPSMTYSVEVSAINASGSTQSYGTVST